MSRHLPAPFALRSNRMYSLSPHGRVFGGNGRVLIAGVVHGPCGKDLQADTQGPWDRAFTLQAILRIVTQTLCCGWHRRLGSKKFKLPSPGEGHTEAPHWIKRQPGREFLYLGKRAQAALLCVYAMKKLVAWLGFEATRRRQLSGTDFAHTLLISETCLLAKSVALWGIGYDNLGAGVSLSPSEELDALE